MRFPWSSNSRRSRNEFPKGFSVQRVGVSSAKELVDLPPEEIADYFRKNIDTAQDLLHESYDKRYSPSSYISEENNGFNVGWFSRRSGYECVRQFSNLPDAATDYLLFSLGRSRWTPIEAAGSNNTLPITR